MNIKTNLLEEYVNFVDNTKQLNKYFKLFSFLIAIIMYLFFLCYLKIIQSNIHTSIRIQV